MSLPHVLRKSPIRFAFRERINFFFSFPEIDQIIKETETFILETNSNKGEAGTAFDYLLRFYTEYLNKDKTILKTKWTALSALKMLYWEIYERKAEYSKEYYWGGEKTTPDLFYKTILSELENVNDNYQSIIKTGEFTPDIFTSCLFLARLDVYVRDSFNLVQNFGVYKVEEINELKKLIGVVPKADFVARGSCILNPYFPKFNADGDLVIDETIIEIKTVDKIELKADFKYQLLFYYILHLINGVNGNRDYSISKLGIYYSRFGILYTVPIKEIGSEKAFESFKKWYLSTLRNLSLQKKGKLYREKEYQTKIDDQIDSFLIKRNILIPDEERPFEPIRIYRESFHGYSMLKPYFDNSNDFTKFKNEVYKKF